jgi:hypothetical protein
MEQLRLHEAYRPEAARQAEREAGRANGAVTLVVTGPPEAAGLLEDLARSA